MSNKIKKYQKIVILYVLSFLNLFLLFNTDLLVLYAIPYILLNLITLLFIIFFKLEILELRKFIDDSLVEINRELLSGNIKPLNIPMKLKYIRDFVKMFNKIVIYLNKKNKTLQKFNSNVSHELKAPITELKADLEYFLYYTNRDNTIINIVKNFIEKIDNIGTITSQMLFISNDNIENLNSAMQRVFLNDIVYDVIENKNNLLKEKKIFLEVEINNAVSLHGHKELLKYAIANILDNAIKYSFENKKIYIYLKEKNNYIYLVIKDYGIGIKKRDMKLIFHPYYRGKNICSSIDGYGLGLSLSSWIFELHGAKIRIRSRHNYGTIIFIKFYF